MHTSTGLARPASCEFLCLALYACPYINHVTNTSHVLLEDKTVALTKQLMNRSTPSRSMRAAWQLEKWFIRYRKHAKGFFSHGVFSHQLLASLVDLLEEGLEDLLLQALTLVDLVDFGPQIGHALLFPLLVELLQLKLVVQLLNLGLFL